LPSKTQLMCWGDHRTQLSRRSRARNTKKQT